MVGPDFSLVLTTSNAMDEIIPGLWVGDLPSAKDTENLKANKIFSILSAMRGRVTINEVQQFCLALEMSLTAPSDVYPPPDSSR